MNNESKLTKHVPNSKLWKFNKHQTHIIVWTPNAWSFLKSLHIHRKRRIQCCCNWKGRWKKIGRWCLWQQSSSHCCFVMVIVVTKCGGRLWQWLLLHNKVAIPWSWCSSKVVTDPSWFFVRLAFYTSQWLKFCEK